MRSLKINKYNWLRLRACHIKMAYFSTKHFSELNAVH